MAELMEQDDYCPDCGAFMDFEECGGCWGEGDYHDCGEDTCCCLYPERDDRVPCEECHGQGGHLICSDYRCGTRMREPHRGPTDTPDTGGSHED